MKILFIKYTFQLKIVITIVLICASISAESSTSRLINIKNDIELFEQAIVQYRRDTGSYPTEEQGLYALKPNSNVERNRLADPKGYIKRVSRDPWGNDYQYRYPGKHNPNTFDIWSMGADGITGGIEPDCGNWSSSDAMCREAYKSPLGFRDRFFLVYGVIAVVGFLLGLPIYIVGCFLRRRDKKRRFVGPHLWTLLYLIIAPLMVAVIVGSMQQ